MRNITIATFWAISATFIAHGANPGDTGEEPWRDELDISKYWDYDTSSYGWRTNSAYKDYTFLWTSFYNCRTCLDDYGLPQHDPDLKRKDTPDYTPRYVLPYVFEWRTNEVGEATRYMIGTEDPEYANGTVGHGFMHPDGDISSDSDLPYLLVRMGHKDFGADQIIYKFPTNEAPDYLEHYSDFIYGDEMSLGGSHFPDWSIVTAKIMFGSNERLPEFLQSQLDAGNYNFRLENTYYTEIDYNTPSEEPIGWYAWTWIMGDPPEPVEDMDYDHLETNVTTYVDEYGDEYTEHVVKATKNIYGYATTTTVETYGKLYWIESHLGGMVHHINFNEGGGLKEYKIPVEVANDPDRHITEWDFASDDPRINFVVIPTNETWDGLMYDYYTILSTTNLLTGMWDVEANLPVTVGDKVISYPVDVEPDVKFFKLQGQTENVVGYTRIRLGGDGGGVPPAP